MNKEEEKLGPMLYVKNIPDQGLRIYWNLTGILFNNDYQNYHLFLPISTQFKLFQQFFNCYYQNLRLGDLVGIFKRNQDQGLNKKIKWTEKTTLGIEKNFLKPKYILDQEEMLNIDEFLNKVKKFNGLVTLNIFFQTKSNIEKSITRMKQKIIELRKTDPDMDKVVINVISDNFRGSMLNSIEGVNYFYYEQQNINHTVQQIINYIKILRLRKLKIRIYFNKNQNFSLVNNSDWRASQNSYIQKVYYSVPNCYFNEYFIFLLRSEGVEIDIDITIALDCIMYNGTEIKAKKNVSFKTNSTAHKAKTWNCLKKQLLGVTQLPNKQSIMSSFGQRYNEIWIYQDSQQ